ncbi:hypothetical protein M569_01342 [Genlisea aurea]|uniref:Homeobox domain-containing protein n=1 Tax=Genlisea aurea TaxID=192259 RepID=S8D224_9LAMI|nr:hypothetical protein M569_01342 [Genlisea aurea]
MDGSDDFCSLGLGFHHTYDVKRKKTPPLEPSLTLSISAENCDVFRNPAAFDEAKSSADLHRQDSVAASPSTGAKKDMEIGVSDETETETEKVSSDDGSNSNRRKKLRLSKAQSALLEESFARYSTLNPMQKQGIARELKLTPRQVEVWFQNRRARTKLKQTELNCELLKKFCNALADENRRLQMELKALKSAPPPAAAICSSCETIAAAVNNPFAITLPTGGTRSILPVPPNHRPAAN